VFAASSIAIARAREKTIMAARRGMRMVMAIARDRIVTAAIVPAFVSVFIAVIVCAHCAVIVGSILGADDGGC
jgi:hypothetical protein